MSTKIFEVWCEWDIGEYGFYSTEEKAIEAGKAALKLQFGDDPDYEWDKLIDEGLIGIKDKELD